MEGVRMWGPPMEGVLLEPSNGGGFVEGEKKRAFPRGKARFLVYRITVYLFTCLQLPNYSLPVHLFTVTKLQFTALRLVGNVRFQVSRRVSIGKGRL